MFYSSLPDSASPPSKITVRRLLRKIRKERANGSGPAAMPAWTLKHKPKSTSHVCYLSLPLGTVLAVCRLRFSYICFTAPPPH